MYPNHPTRRKDKAFFFLFIVVAGLALAGLVMGLWNSILPDVLQAPPISYFQALGLLVLSRILFGRFHFGGPGPRRGWREKFRNLSEEERRKLREQWRERCRARGDR